VSITRVSVTRDLSRANITYMPLGGGAISDAMAEAVARAGRRLRGPIGRALRLRYAPVLVFHPDEHTEAAFRVMRLLDEIEPMAEEPEEQE
jgi:ribosome-binding factor A